MVSTKMDDLNDRYEADLLDDISPQEMENIHGGFIPRRWRRNPRTVDVPNIITGIPSIDTRINSWQAELDKNYDLLRTDFSV